MQRRPLITHIGLGDNIVQTGMARTLAERYGTIAFPCYEFYEASVKSFFVNDPGVEVYTLPHDLSWDWGSPPDGVWDRRIKECGFEGEPIRAGNYSGRGTDWDFTSSFYLHAEVPYDDRFDKCPIFEAAKSVEQLPVEFPNDKRIFLHDDPMRGYTITRFRDRNEAYHPDATGVTSSILRYLNLILAAVELHVIDSCFFHFINSLPFVPGRLYLHQYPRWPRHWGFRYPSRLNWTYLP